MELRTKIKTLIKKQLALLLTITLTGAAYLPGQTRVYKEKEGEKVTFHRIQIEPTTVGYTINLTSESGSKHTVQKFQLDTELATLSWSYEAPHTKTKITAFRKENKIFLQGIDDGDPVEKTFKINEFPWNQTFNIGLEKFALSPEESMKFWAIGTSGPGNMKITKFNVKRKEIETITLNSMEQPIEAIHFTISLTGLLSMFWTGHYWFRKSDGRFLKFSGKNRASGPVAVSELISES